MSMQFPVDGPSSEPLPAQREDPDRAAKSPGIERRYKHIAKLGDSQKQRHNLWVLGSARAHQAHCLVLDGLNLFTTKTLIDGGIPVRCIHVPNKSDYDAIIAAAHPVHGNIYRCGVLQWAQSLVSLAPCVAAESRAPGCASACNGIKTIWLDFTCRWSTHVESTLALLLSPFVMGAGSGDLFLTLNADTRCPSAMRALGAQNYIRDLVMRKGGSVEFPLDRCEEYGNGMFILQAAVNWSSCFGDSTAGAALYERMRGEARAFRKEQNSLKAMAD